MLTLPCSAAFILKVFGGVVADLRAFLGEERLPDGWEPRKRHRMGYSMNEMNLTIGYIELGVEAEVDGSLRKQTFHPDQAAEKPTAKAAQ